MMKHTNSDNPERGDDLDDIQVIENTTNDIAEEKPQNSHELSDVNTMAKDTNVVNQKPGIIDHETYYLSKPDEKSDVSVTKAKKYSKPILPKILVALLVILVMSVIALAFVLYHIDQQLMNNKDKTNRMGYDLDKDKQKITQLERSIGNETVIRVEKDFKEYFVRLTRKTDKNNYSLIALKRSFKKDVHALKQDSNKSNARILGLETAFKNEIPRLSNESIELNETLIQLDMFMEFKEHYDRGRIGLTFKEVVKLAQKQNRVDKEIPHLILLDYQYKQFNEKYEARWGINYSDVIRLTERVDFTDNKPIPLLQKIDCMFKIFEGQFQKIWNITFKDIIRLTTKEDIAAMTVSEWIELQEKEGVPSLLDKISHMYQRFEKRYKDKWGIPFQDVISLTDRIDFAVNETVPILQTIDAWYFEGFKEIWGDGFPGYVRVMMSSKGIDRTAILKKLQHINATGRVFKFLPGTFEYMNKELSVYGYVAVYYNSTFLVTIYKQFLKNNAAKVLCKSAGYSQGVYDGGKYNVGNMNRNSLKCWYNSIKCKTGNEATIDKCGTDTGGPWEHKDDAGVKCYF